MSKSFRRVSCCLNLSLKTLFLFYAAYLKCLLKRRIKMKAITATAFALILSTSSVFAGGCSKHNKANLEAMSCQTGFTWDENAGECVEAPNA